MAMPPADAADLATGLLVNVPDRLEHHERDRVRRLGQRFPVEVSMKSGASGHRKQRSAATLSYVPSSPTSRITFRWASNRPP